MGFLILAILIFVVEFLPPIIFGDVAPFSFLPFVHPYLVGATLILIFGIKRLLNLKVRRSPEELYFFILPLILLLSANYIYLYRVHLPAAASSLSDAASLAISAVTGMALTALITGTVRAQKRIKDGKAAAGTKNFLLLITMLSYFLALSISYSLYIFSPLLRNLIAVLGAVFVSTWIAISFLNFINERKEKSSAVTSIILSFVAAEIAWISSFWATFYIPRFIESDRENAAIPLPAILITVLIIYAVWGILTHRDEHDLSRKVLNEYLLVGGAVTAFLLLTTKWYLG